MPTAAVETDLFSYCEDLGRRARAAARLLALAKGGLKNAWLLRTAEVLESHGESLVQANAKDLEAAPGFGLSSAQIDRLRVTPARLRGAAAGLREVAALPDPV